MPPLGRMAGQRQQTGIDFIAGFIVVGEWWGVILTAAQQNAGARTSTKIDR